jgi:hypothetical protein
MSEANQIEGVPEGWRLVRISKWPKVGEYAIYSPGEVVKVTEPDQWDLACIVEKIEPPKPRYRPFADAKEFAEHPRSGDWVTDQGFKFCKISFCCASGVRFDGEFIRFESAVDELKFLDGTPFGIEVVE